MVLLRQTNRLNTLLAQHGYKFDHSTVTMEMDADDEEEAEFIRYYSSQHAVVEADYRITENSPSHANAFHSILNRLERYGYRDGFTLKRVNGEQPDTAPNSHQEGLDRIGILWVSPTEFVTIKLFDELSCEDMYQMTVVLKPYQRPFTLYSYGIFQFNEAGEIMVGPPPVTPPQFLSHVLAPILDQVASIMLFCHRGTPPADSALSLIQRLVTISPKTLRFVFRHRRASSCRR
jgi:hypothetical protein